ncbi:MAG: ThiF family adenylyltransferase [Flavobacteriaceae bacterium]
MKWKIKFRESTYCELTNWLFSTAPKENGCFLLVKNKGKILFVDSIYYPKENDWLLIDESSCSPSSKYISSACFEANKTNSGLVFVHTHPMEGQPKRFSLIDKISNEKLFNNLSKIISQPLGSFVLTKSSIHGVVFFQECYQPINSYSIMGCNIKIIYDINTQVENIGSIEFKRQMLFMKRNGQSLFSSLKIAVIGAGGIGSPLATMLAKMGASEIDLFDDDSVEEHNLPRIYGASHKDINKYKVDVVKKSISNFSSCKIGAFSQKVGSDILIFQKYDVIFGCVDNHTTRAFLNGVSVDLAIPYIDSSCAIPMNDRGEVMQAVTSVTTVMPMHTCLWCSDVIDGMKIMEESLNEDEIKNRKDDGYLSSIIEAPSVITLTTSVATNAINRLLNLIGILSENYPTRVVYDFNDTMIFEPSISNNMECLCKVNSPFSN